MSGNGRSRPLGLQRIDRDLLGAARALHQGGHAAPAVVTAHAATEVVSEFVMARFFEIRGVPELEEPVEELARWFHLSNDRVRRLYEVLAADQIGSTALWRRFKTHIDRR